MLNFGDMLAAIEAAIDPAWPACIQGKPAFGWGEAARCSDNPARALLAGIAETGDKLAMYMRTCSE